MSRPVGSKNFSSIEKVMRLLREKDALTAERDKLREENKELKLNLATHSPCAESFNKMVNEADASRQLAAKYRETLEEIIEECSDDFCVKIDPEYTPPCACGIARAALQEEKRG